MGCWDIYCPLCGLLLNGLDLNDIFNDNNLNIKIVINNNVVKWLEKCTILLPNQKAKHNYVENECNICFINKKNNKQIIISDKDDNDKSMGIVLHTDCWKYVKKCQQVVKKM